MADVHPGYGGSTRSSGGRRAGTGGGGDQTTQPGQYPSGPDAIFGGPVPTSTGAPGTAGGGGASADDTVEAGQLTGDFGGLSTSEITDTGAPGSAGGRPSTGSGGDAVTFTRPGSYLSGTYTQDTVNDDIDGAGEWTEANDSGYGTGGPQMPALRGNQPTSTGAGQGRVMRGGRMRGGG